MEQIGDTNDRSDLKISVFTDVEWKNFRAKFLSVSGSVLLSRKSHRFENAFIAISRAAKSLSLLRMKRICTGAPRLPFAAIEQLRNGYGR